MSSVNSIASEKLFRLIGTPKCPAIIDVRADDDFSTDPRLVPGSGRQPNEAVGDWAAEFRGQSVVVICHKGLKLSHGVAAFLRDAWYRSGRNLGVSAFSGTIILVGLRTDLFPFGRMSSICGAR
jgi:rhodanese-related sulfurtransferase